MGNRTQKEEEEREYIFSSFLRFLFFILNCFPKKVLLKDSPRQTNQLVDEINANSSRADQEDIKK